jgi:hypothetical protein
MLEMMFMRFLIRILIVSAIFCLAVKVSFAQDIALSQKFTAINSAFSVRYPADWYVYVALSGEIIFAPQTVGVNVMAGFPGLVSENEILLSVEVKNMSVEERVAEIFTDIPSAGFSEWEEVEFNGPSTTNAYPATRIQLANWSIATSIEVIDLGSDGVMTLGVWVPEEDRVLASSLLDAVGSTLVLNAPASAPVPATMPIPTYGLLSYSQAVDLRTVVADDAADLFTLSPDGTRVAYTSDGSLCIINTRNLQVNCASLSIQVYPTQLRWSPNSRYIAFTNLMLSDEMPPSILVYDTDDGSFINLTRDETLPIEIQVRQDLDDFVVLWAHDSQSLYSWRWYGGLGIQGLFRRALDGTEIQFVANFTPTFDNSPAYRAFSESLAGDIVTSPDGTQLALSVVHPNYVGIILIDLQTGTLRRLISSDEVSVVLPDQPENSSTPLGGLSWSADGSGLYLHSSNRRNTLGNLFFLDIETNDITALIDFAPFSVANIDAMIAGEDAFALDIPMLAAAPPNGDAVVYVGKTGETVRITRVRFSEGTFETEIAYEFDMADVSLRGSTMIASDGSALLGELLLLP